MPACVCTDRVDTWCPIGPVGSTGSAGILFFVFVNCVIENPSFDSQTKDYLNTSVSKFGSTCEVGNTIIDKLAKMGVMNASCALSDIKDKQNAKK